MQRVRLTNKDKKNTFGYFDCFRVVKVAQFRLVEPEVSKIKYFCLKKNLSMLDRTLTTPINLILIITLQETNLSNIAVTEVYYLEKKIFIPTR